MMDNAFNPKLTVWARHQPSAEPGAGDIEVPGTYQNLTWQTRSAVPGEYEIALVEAIEFAFEQGDVELADVVARLNAIGMRDHAGHAWSEASFRNEMATLGH
ncbi:recombinase-like helix-turn-helix domain-containing protein [Dyella sp. ASV21]|uniref:recombinase-like helix-turn-helix domain-containing protein n=1 Tax=Dyella sp. ASV21 TaxID=2795114 RepID=UPI0018ED6EB0|nr:recombinase-like helix-turn-helix domain-containing protein [Dyella sp. ASV21]